MPRDGTQTRNRILDSALVLALEKGLAAASLDQVIERAEITKGAFFYHFKSKDELALALVSHVAELDRRNHASIVARVEGLSRDPLQQVLLACSLTADLVAPSEPNPGCLFASYCYQGDLWSEAARKICESNFQEQAAWIEGKLKQAAKLAGRKGKSALPVSPAQLAMMFHSVFEGAFVLARTYNDASLFRKQVLAYRDMLEAVFKPAK
ncbi:MAG: TetR/AcrR family transcriptional regulator [Planctomycetes bacterium]|nr:TetR/AcrR family transcriptional regulator [Planctomycetota bacterium]